MTADARELPEGWSWVELADLTSMCRRGRTPAYADGTTLILNQKCVRHATDIDLSAAKRTNEDGKPIPDWAVLQEGDLLVNSTGTGTLGRVAWLRRVPERATADTHVTIVRPDPSLVRPSYLGYYMHSLQATFESMATGSTNQKELRPGDLQKLGVPLAPLDEQDAIVVRLQDALETGRAAAQSLAEARARRLSYRRAVLQEALADCVGPAGKPELPSLPPGWEWSTVSAEGSVQLGRMLNKERSSGPHMHPYLRVANVLDDALDLTDVKEMDFPPGEFQRYHLHPGDILLNEGQSPELLGRPAMYRGGYPGLCFQKTLLRFQPRERVDAEFALLVFLYYLYAGRFRRESRITTGIGHLTGVRFAAMEFPVPPLDEQRNIVKRVREQTDAMDELDARLAQAEADAAMFRRAVLHDAFTGGAKRMSPHRDARAVPVGEYS